MSDPDIYDNIGHVASLGVPVQCPNNDAAGAQTVIYVPIPNVLRGTFLDVRATTVLDGEPQGGPCVTGSLLWLTPTNGVPGWSPTALNASLHGTQWETSDIAFDPASGAGKYLKYDRDLTIRAPFDMGDVLAILSVYAASDAHAGSISLFPSQTSIHVLRSGPGSEGGVWKAVLDDTMRLQQIF